MLERNPVFHRLASLIAQEREGLYGLPAEVTAAWTTAERLANERERLLRERSSSNIVESARANLRDAIRHAAESGTAFPDGRDVVDAASAREAFHAVLEGLDDCVMRAQGEF